MNSSYSTRPITEPNPLFLELSKLDAAIARARTLIFASQLPDGSWNDPSNAGPAATAQIIIALRFLNYLPDKISQPFEIWLKEQQRADGSFAPYPTSESSDLAATACCLAAFKAAGISAFDPVVQKANKFVRENGGFEKTVDLLLTGGDPTALYLVMMGMLPGDLLPKLPLVPLLFSPLRKFLEKRFNAGILMTALQIDTISDFIARRPGSGVTKDPSFIRKMLNRFMVNYTQVWQNPAGHWNANSLQTALGIIGLVSAGVQREEENMQKGIAWLQRQLVTGPMGGWFNVFSADVWSTAFNLRALIVSGVPVNHPAMTKALHWVVEAQLNTPPPEIGPKRPKHAPRTGGWGFQSDNVNMPDCDDAGVVLTTLARVVNHDGKDRVDEVLFQRLALASKSGREWLLGMQNPDGGWSAFVWGMPSIPQGPIMDKPIEFPKSLLERLKFLWKPPVQLGEPSTADLTARVIHGLALNGINRGSLEMAKAVKFLQRQQLENGSWWGRWSTNYLASTASVLMGAAAMGIDATTAWVHRGMTWLELHQNTDGGWGETEASYTDPQKAGIGPSMPPLTGWVICALIDVGHGDSDAVKRGVDYLLQQQDEDGGWSNNGWIQPYVPPSTYYFYPTGARFFPLMAISRYRNLKSKYFTK